MERLKQFLLDMWLGFGLIGMAIGLAAPIFGIGYVLYKVLE